MSGKGNNINYSIIQDYLLQKIMPRNMMDVFEMDEMDVHSRLLQILMIRNIMVISEMDTPFLKD